MTLRDRVSGPTQTIEDRLRRAKVRAQELRQSLDNISGASTKLLATGAAVAALGVAGTSASAQFQQSMAQIATLVDTNTVDMDAMRKSVLELSRQFGVMPDTTALGFYQAVSFFGADVDRTTRAMTASMKLQKIGLIDTNTAMNALGNTLGGMGMGLERITEVSDSMVVAMKMSKTTVGELADALPQVAPIANAVGLSIDELVATVGALTLGGKKTNEAVTGLRGVMVAITKPTAEAEKLAKKLGLTFSTTGVRDAGGFAKWLEILRVKTGGNSEVLAQLFGDVEGLGAALSLVGPQGEAFTQILEAMGGKAGETEKAFKKVDETLIEAFNKKKVAVYVQMIDLFDRMLPKATAALDKTDALMAKYAQFSQAHPTAATTGVTFALYAAGALIAIGALGKLVVGIGRVKLAIEAIVGWAPKAWAALGRFGNAIGGGIIAVINALPRWAGIVSRTIGRIGVSVGGLASVLAEPLGIFLVWFDSWDSFATRAANTGAEIMRIYDRVNQAVSLAVGKLINSIADSGEALWNQFVAGLERRWPHAMARIEAMIARIRDMFPHSDAKIGPLSRLTAQGRALPDTLASGIYRGAPQLLRATNWLADQMAGVVAEGASRNPTPAQRTPRPTAGGVRVGQIVVNYNGKERLSRHDIEQGVAAALHKFSYQVGRS